MAVEIQRRFVLKLLMTTEIEDRSSFRLADLRATMPWPVLSPMPESYREISRDFQRCALFVTEEVMQCSRRPLRVLNQSTQYSVHSDRLNRCQAYGQHLQRLPSNRQNTGQFGLYGTAAALELLGHCEEADRFSDYPGENREWARQFLETWNFIDLMVLNLSCVDNTNCWEQSCNVLRICHLLRAVSVAAGRLEAFTNELRRQAALCDERVIADLQNDIQGSIRNVVAKLHQSLTSARVSASAFSEAFRSDSLTTQFTFHYACGTNEVPENWKDWLFVWSSVLVAVLRAYENRLLDDDKVGQLITVSDKNRIIDVIKATAKYGDDRFRLFGLWSLNHLAPSPYSLRRHHAKPSETLNPAQGRVPDQLALGSNEISWLVKEVENTTSNLLGSEAALRDVHSPYHIVFHPQSAAERWTNDHFVIPVLPIMLELVTQYKPEWLFRPQIGRILKLWRDTSGERDGENNLKTLPFQNGNYNGTVNALYYRQAALVISDALAANSRRAWYLVPLGLLRDNSRLTFVLILAMVAIGATIWYFLYGSPSDKAIGLFLGACISIIANLITPPFARWLWNQRS